MRIANIGLDATLEALSKPEVTDTALFFKVFPKASACCLKRCCSVGMSIPCDNIFPHQQGLVIQNGESFLLNNTTVVNQTLSPKEIQVEKTDCTTVLGWVIPSRVFKAFEHPWGAVLVLEKVFLETEKKYSGLVLGFLVVPH